MKDPTSLTSPRYRLRGMAAAEFLLLAVPLMLTGLGAFEAARWHLTRQAAGYALMEAARAGSVSGANPAAIEAALQRALLPLWGADACLSGRQRAKSKL